MKYTYFKNLNSIYYDVLCLQEISYFRKQRPEAAQWSSEPKTPERITLLSVSAAAGVVRYDFEVIREKTNEVETLICS